MLPVASRTVQSLRVTGGPLLVAGLKGSLCQPVYSPVIVTILFNQPGGLVSNSPMVAATGLPAGTASMCKALC